LSLYPQPHNYWLLAGQASKIDPKRNIFLGAEGQTLSTRHISALAIRLRRYGDGTCDKDYDLERVRVALRIGKPTADRDIALIDAAITVYGSDHIERKLQPRLSRRPPQLGIVLHLLTGKSLAVGAGISGTTEGITLVLEQPKGHEKAAEKDREQVPNIE